MSTIADRTLFGVVEDAVVRINVAVLAPEIDSHGTWVCQAAVQSDGYRLPTIRPGHGVDRIQAILHAMLSIGKTLDESGVEWALTPEPFEKDGAKYSKLIDDHFPRKILAKHLNPED